MTLTTILAPPLDPIRYSTSWSLPAYLLGSLRALVSVYIFVTIIAQLSHYSVHDPQELDRHFSYFTILSWWGSGFYFAVAAMHSWSYWLRGGKPWLQSWGSVLIQLHGVLYSTIVVFPLIVTSK